MKKNLPLIFLLLSNLVFSTPQDDLIKPFSIENGEKVTEATNKFLSDENKKNGANWKSVGYNLKELIPKCLVPLRVMWASKNKYSNYNKYNNYETAVIVICDKIGHDYQKKWGFGEKWSIGVTVMTPKKN